MRTIVVTPPATPLISWDEARAHLRMEDGDERQPYVMGLVAGASAHIDGPAGWLNRAIGVQTLETRFDAFPCDAFRLPYGPVISITTLKYTDSAGEEQTISTVADDLLGSDLRPAYGTAWPAARWQREAVRIRYQAGYSTDAPAPIKIAVGLMVKAMFDGASANEALAGSVAALLQPFQVYA